MRMNHLYPIAVLLFLLPAAVFAAYAHTETWDGGTLAGWTRNTIDAEISHSATGGNPNGYIECTYLGSPTEVFEIGAVTNQDSFTGDLTAAGITAASVDLYFEEGIYYGTARLRFRYLDSNHNGWVYALTSDFTPTPWKTYSVDFDPTWTDQEALSAGWTQESSTPSFQETMANVYTTEIRLAGSAVIAGIDNFTLIPEPASLSLLALGAIALIKRRK